MIKRLCGFLIIQFIFMFASIGCTHADTPLMAVINTGDDSILGELMDSPTEVSKALGLFYNGVSVEIWDQDDKWSYVVMPEGVRGYIKTDNLTIEKDRFNVPIAIQIKSIEVKSDSDYTEVNSADGKIAVYLSQGTLVEVHGYYGDRVFIRLGNIFGFVNSEDLCAAPYAIGDLYSLPSLGHVLLDEEPESIATYAYPSNKKAEGRYQPVSARITGKGSNSSEMKLELLADLDDYLQTRYNYHIEFIRKEDVLMIEMNPSE